jgi:hypothetical protein
MAKGVMKDCGQPSPGERLAALIVADLSLVRERRWKGAPVIFK